MFIRRLSAFSPAARARALFLSSFHGRRATSARILDFTVAGVIHAGAEAETALHSLSLGETVLLRLDDRAGESVCVETVAGMRLGWLPESALEQVTPLLEQNEILHGEVIGFVQPDSFMDGMENPGTNQMHVVDTRCFAPILRIPSQ